MELSKTVCETCMTMKNVCYYIHIHGWMHHNENTHTHTRVMPQYSDAPLK